MADLDAPFGISVRIMAERIYGGRGKECEGETDNEINCQYLESVSMGKDGIVAFKQISATPSRLAAVSPNFNRHKFHNQQL